MTMPDNLFVSDHPLVVDKLSQLRDENTAHPRFRELLEEISQIIFLRSKPRPCYGAPGSDHPNWKRLPLAASSMIP